VPIRMTSALDAHPIVCDIIADRARAMSLNPEREAIVLVAHGPNEEQENQRWLQSLDEIGRAVARTTPFAHIGRLTVRDDAPAPVKEAATAQLRSLVASQVALGRRVLIVPVLLSYGGIEAGIRQRLDGLSYVMSDKALAPDPRLVDWVLAMALRFPDRPVNRNPEPAP
jgi:sirohydrochlorin cobaltochelatase